jgi:putative ATP-binding cassette transporter
MLGLLSFMARYSRRSVIMAITAGVVSGACNTALLAILNAALHRGNASTPRLVWGFVAFCLLLPVARFVSEVLLSRLGQATLYDLRVKLSRKILNAPLRQLEELGAHRLLTSLTDDIPVITNALLNIPLICINLAVVLGGLAYLGWLSPVMLLAVLFFMAVGIASYQLPVLKAMRYFRSARENADALMKAFRALTQGTKELKLHARRREAFLEQSLQAAADSMRRNNVQGMMVHTAAASWGQVLVFVVVGLTLFVLPSLRPTNTQMLTGYTLVLLYLMTPLQVLMNALPALSRASVAIKKVEALGLSLKSERAAAPDAAAAEPEPGESWETLELVGVTHSYRREGEENNFTLGPVDLTITRGELAFLVGGNGSGKTTLAKLLVGLYMPEGGEIRVDGVPLKEENLESYRQHFSVVFSDFYLFENLHGMEALDAEAEQHLKRLQLDHKVKVQDGVLSTTDLSQGQRKRLALLTAYLEGRPVYLFDEWAADQDPMFKEVFYYQLLPELKAKGRTVIVISHDDRYYHVGDRIIKMDSGKIVYDVPALEDEIAEPKLALPLVSQ